MLHPQARALLDLIEQRGVPPTHTLCAADATRLTDCGNRAAYVLFPRQIHGFVTMGKLIDEAGTAIALCAGELRRLLKPAA